MGLPVRLVAADPLREGRGGVSPTTARPAQIPQETRWLRYVCHTRGIGNTLERHLKPVVQMQLGCNIHPRTL